MRNVTYILYDKTVVSDLPQGQMWRALGYKVETDNLTRCFLRLDGSLLVNPKAISIAELKNLGEYFQEVPLNMYEKYLDIINMKSRTPLRSLERLL